MEIKYNNEKEDKINKNIKNIEEKGKIIEKENQKLKKDKKELLEKYEIIKKENEEFKKKNKKLENEINEKKLKVEELNQKINDLQRNKNNILEKKEQILMTNIPKNTDFKNKKEQKALKNTPILSFNTPTLVGLYNQNLIIY